MQDCAEGMGACSNRICQFPFFPPPNPGIGHTTDRCIVAIKSCSKTINFMKWPHYRPSLPPACNQRPSPFVCILEMTSCLMWRKHVEKRVAIKVESSISDSISLSHCWPYLSRQNQSSKYKWDITTMNRYHQKVHKTSKSLKWKRI